MELTELKDKIVASFKGTKKQLTEILELVENDKSVFPFNEIVIWIMSSKEVLNHPDYSKGQHRGNKGNEGQLHIRETNIKTLEKYKLGRKNLKTVIKNAAKRK